MDWNAIKTEARALAARRAERMAALLAGGLTLREIAEREGISRQRVHRLLSVHGLLHVSDRKPTNAT